MRSAGRQQGAVKSTVRVSQTYYPRPEYAQVYAKRYAAYRAVVDGLSGVWEVL